MSSLGPFGNESYTAQDILPLFAPIDLQLVLLPHAKTSREEVGDMTVPGPYRDPSM